jgi:hypothetical protein
MSGALLRKDAVTSMVNSLMALLNKTSKPLVDQLAEDGAVSSEGAESFKEFAKKQGIAK